jgi:hypothetical protein
LMSLAMTGMGLVGYRRANHRVNTLQIIIPEEEATT